MRHLYANRSRALGLPRLGRAPAHEFYRGPSSSSSLAGSRARLSRHREAVGARLPLPRTTVAWSSRVKNPAFRSIRCSCTSAPRPTGSQIHGHRTQRENSRHVSYFYKGNLFVRGRSGGLLAQFVRICWFLVFVGYLERIKSLACSDSVQFIVSLYIAR